MLQDVPTPTLREARACVLETERLMLRRPTLADVKTIAHLADDRRIAENTRRLPHPYLQEHAIKFVRATANDRPETVFLIENNFVPIGMVGIDWREPDAPELGYWLGVEYWGQGFATEAARAVIDLTFEEFDVEHLISGARVSNPSSRNILEKCGFQWSGVELHRFEALGSSSPVDCFLPLARRLVIAEELGELHKTRTVSSLTASPKTVAPAKAGAHNHQRLLSYRVADPASHNNEHSWLWVPAQGRDDGVFFLGRWIDHDLLASQLALPQKDVEPRADDDHGTYDGRR